MVNEWLFRLVVRGDGLFLCRPVVDLYYEEIEEELVAYDVPATAARRRTGSITGRDWA